MHAKMDPRWELPTLRGTMRLGVMYTFQSAFDHD